jgi:hypothetical protein
MCVSITYANLLLNPGFEIEGTQVEDAANWTEPSEGEGVRKNVRSKSGSWCFNVWEAGLGYPNVSQTVDMGMDVSSQEFTFSIYAMHTDVFGRSLNEGNSGIVKMEFLKADGTYISSVDNWFFDSTETFEQWVHGEVTAIAPAETQQIRVQAMLVGVGETAEIFFDDAVLIPEPATLSILLVGGVGGLVFQRKK